MRQMASLPNTALGTYHALNHEPQSPEVEVLHACAHDCDGKRAVEHIHMYSNHTRPPEQYPPEQCPSNM